MKKIVIIGGGNIGTLLALEISRNYPGGNIYIFTGQKNSWAKELFEFDINDNLIYSSSNIIITDALGDISDGDIYFFTTPKNVIQNSIASISQVAKKDCAFVYVPGTGGVEFLHKKYCKENIKIIGLQRVPFIARLKEYGKSVKMLSKKDAIYISSLEKDIERYASFLDQILDIKVVILDNYLNITLTPSNPILHTTRLYGLFFRRDKNYIYAQNPYFYAEWDLKSAYMLFKCDEELQKLCRLMKGLDLSGVVSLRRHYESPNIFVLKKKLRSIQAFKEIKSPMIKVDNGYKVDWDSRYFTEDFPYGLSIIKAFAEIYNLKTPYIDKVLNWYYNISNNIMSDRIPQNFGIITPYDVIKFYKNS